MKKLLIAVLLMAGMATNAWAIDVAIIVEDNTSRTTIGVDTLLGDFLVNVLGYTVTYRDIDTVQTHTYWDGAGYEKIIVVGTEDALPSPDARVDSIAASSIPFMVIGSDMWDESNLGTGKVTQTEGTGYIINIGQSHYITRTTQDTVILWTTQGTGLYSIVLPDTGIRNIDVLLLDKDSRADTSAAIMVACEAGDTVFNTGDGRIVANQRRVFFGSWQYQAYPMDSCQFYTLFARSVCWLDADTLNSGLLSNFCFSGAQEVQGSYVVENSSGTDSVEIYGGYNNMYAGLDFDHKKFFIKPTPLAVQRKLTNQYRSLSLGSLKLSLMLKAKVWDNSHWPGGVSPTEYSSTVAFAPLIRYWKAQAAGIYFFSEAAPFACWTYRYGETVGGTFTAYPWSSGGASDEGVDHDATYLDSITITEASALNTRYWVNLDTVVVESRLLDSSLFQGWVANTLSATYTGPGVEVGFYSPVNSLGSRPYIIGSLSSFSTSEPTPTITIDAGTYDADSIVFTGIYGQTIASQEVSVTNSAGGALQCLSIADDAAWSTIVADNANTPLTFTMYIPFGQQAVGYRSGTVTVTCADASNSPKTFKIVSLITAATARQAKGAIEIR